MIPQLSVQDHDLTSCVRVTRHAHTLCTHAIFTRHTWGGDLHA